MAPPLKWNTLEEASIWLCEKTKEDWTPKRIIDFSIAQCKPDNVVEDYKYPSYLRAIIPKSISDCFGWVSLRLDDSLPASVNEGTEVKGKEIKTTFVFRNNLIELDSLGKTALHYVSYNDRSHIDSSDESNGQKPPITVYCEFRPLLVFLDDPYPEFPSIPVIYIDFETIGVRDRELKQLLHDYLALPKESSVVKRGPKLSRVQCDKASFQGIAKAHWAKNPELTQAEIIDCEEMEYFKLTYPGKNTLPDWAREVDPRPKDSRRGRPKKYPST